MIWLERYAELGIIIQMIGLGIAGVVIVIGLVLLVVHILNKSIKKIRKRRKEYYKNH